MEQGLKCTTVRNLLPILLDGALTESASNRVRSHLLGCPSCRTEYGALRQLMTAVTTAGKQGQPDGMEFLAAVRGRIARRERQRAHRIWFASAAAAVLMAGIGLFMLDLNHPGGPGQSMQTVSTTDETELLTYAASHIMNGIDLLDVFDFMRDDQSDYERTMLLQTALYTNLSGDEMVLGLDDDTVAGVLGGTE